MPKALKHVGLTFMTDLCSAWRVVHCTGRAINVSMYLVWYAYDTRRLWWIPPHLRLAIRAFSSDAMLAVIMADGYLELVRLLDVVYRASWDYVPENQSERSRRSRNVVFDHSPGGRERVQIILTLIRQPVIPLILGRPRGDERGCMQGFTVVVRVLESSRCWVIPRSFHDFQHAAAELLPDPENVVPILGPQAGSIRLVP